MDELTREEKISRTLRKRYREGLTTWNKGLSVEDPRVAAGISNLNRAMSSNSTAWRTGRTKDVCDIAAKQAIKVKQLYDRKVHIPWNKGLTKKTDARVRKNAESISKVLSEKFANGEITSPGASSRGGFRYDLNSYFRSSWEANFARLLKFLHCTYVYEPIRFTLSNGHVYVPDFLIVELNRLVEIKGWWYDDSLEKVVLFQREYLEMPLDVIDDVEYKKLEEAFSHYISTWEYL